LISVSWNRHYATWVHPVAFVVYETQRFVRAVYRAQDKRGLCPAHY
jgi:hypothetical protein